MPVFTGQILRSLKRSLPLVIASVLSLQSVALADPPLREWRDFSNIGVLLPGATARCGFPIFGDFIGSSHFTVFFDNTGAIVREVDTFPSLKVTIYAPSTGKSYTSPSPAVLHAQYTDGAAVGSTAVAELTGLLEKVDGIQMDGGRFVFNAVVTRIDAAGVPIIRFTSVISSSGPDLDTPPIGQARCNAMKP